ncbi:MAG: DUF3530 family protein [Cellvibrio sp.]
MSLSSAFAMQSEVAEETKHTESIDPATNTGIDSQTTNTKTATSRDSEVNRSSFRTGVTQLATALPEDAIWLDIPRGKIMALFRPNFSPETKGAVVILSSISPSQDMPAQLRSLQVNLPYHGWETLLIDTTTISSSSTSSSPSSEDHLRDVLESGLAFQRARNIFNVIIMMDNTIASDLMTNLSHHIGSKNKTGKSDGMIQMLIMLNIQNEHSLNRKQLTNIFTAKHLPFVDVFFHNRNGLNTDSARTHLAIANNQQMENYYQLFQSTLAEQLVDHDRNHIVHRIRGVIERSAKGIELGGTVSKE